jgi:hypothetical protein
MTDYTREVKRQLRDVYRLTPSRTIGDEPCFDHIKDGIYPMVIGGRQEYPVIIAGKFYLLLPTGG